MARSSCPKQVLGFFASWVPTHFKERQSGRSQCTGFLKALGNCVFQVVRLGPYYLCHMIAYDAEMDKFLFYS